MLYFHRPVLFFQNKQTQQCSFSLFESCNCVNFCSENSLCRGNFHSLIENFAILFQRTITALFYYSLTETFAAKFHFVRGFVLATVSNTAKTQSFRTSELLFEKTRLSLVMFLCLLQHIRKRNTQLHQRWKYR